MQVFVLRPAHVRAIAKGGGLLLIAALIQWSLYPFVGARAPFIFFLPAVGIAAMWLGWLPALIVLLGGYINSAIWLAPEGSMGVQSLGDRVALGGYLVAGAILLAMGEYMRRLRVRAMGAEQRLAGLVHDLSAIQEVGGRLLLMSEVPEQFSAVLRALCELLDTDKAQVYLFDPAADCLQSAASVGLNEGTRNAWKTTTRGVGASGIAFKENRAVLVQDTELDDRFADWREITRAAGVRSLQSRPLVNMKGEVFGVLTVYFSEPREPSERESHLADVLSQLTSVVAERQMLAERSKALSQRVEVALQTSAVPFAIFEPVRDASGQLVDSRWEYLNKAAARTFGRQPGELQGRSTRETVPQAWKHPRISEGFGRAHDSGTIVEYDLKVPINGEQRWFHVLASPLGNSLAVWFADISERKRHEQMLQEADRRKDEFLATLAHELRNPLAPIRQATQIARLPKATPEQKQWGLEVIDRQVSHMAVLLDDLLDVARITRGKMELRLQVVDLRAVVDAAIESAGPAIEKRYQHLSVEWTDAPFWIKADPMRMSQVISNLLANASKYTQTEGNIKLFGRREGDQAILEVQDNGIGIPQEDLERVFEMFTQVRHTRSGSSAGLGIGLALARGIAQMHGGSLAAHSPGVDHGSTFTLRIPLSLPAESALGAARPAASQRKRRLLVADDNRDAADSLAEVLRLEGHEVTVAFDGQSALRAFHETHPEAALLDIGMPGMNGYELATAIRASPAGAATLLIAITGWGQERDRTAASEAGFDFHYTKPVKLDELLRVVENPPKAARASAAELP
jgi:PAS domain S-box-containing protein